MTCAATGEVVPLIHVNIRDKKGEAKYKFKYGTDKEGKPKYRQMTVSRIDNAITRDLYMHAPGNEKKRNNVEATVSADVSGLDGDKTKYMGLWRNHLYFSCRCIGINARRIELHVSKKSRKGKGKGAA